MFLNLHRKGRPAAGTGRKVTVQEKAVVEEKETPPCVSAYSFFYPPPVLKNITLVEESSNPLLAPDYEERTRFHQRKKAYFNEQAGTFAHFAHGNLTAIHKAFVQVTSDDGTLSKQTYNFSLQSLGVTDLGAIDRTFELFDVRKDGVVDYKEVISALDVILNGTNKNITCKDCFALLDPAGCGYILQPELSALKGQREEVGSVTHLMVKTLFEIIERKQTEDAERFRLAWLKKNKKKKGKKSDKRVTPANAKGAPAPGGKKAPAGPQQVQKKIHLSYDEFSECLSSDPLLVQAFLTRVLLTMENVYQRNKRATAAFAAATAS